MSKYYTDPATGQRVEIKKTHKFRNFVVLPVLGVFAIIMIVVAANGGGGSGSQAPAPVAVSPNDTGGSGTGTAVTYEVSGSGTGMVTYSTQDLQISQETNASLPWNKTVNFPDGTFFQPLTLTATNGMNSSGEITCTISKDGKVVAENTSSGPYASVNCNG